MSQVNLPVASHKGMMEIGSAKIRCFVLDGFTSAEPIRLLSGRAITQAFGLTGRGQGMTRFINSKTLSGHISEELVEAILNPIPFVVTSGIKPSLGYEAKILPELCFAVMDAYLKGSEVKNQGQPPLRTYEQARILAKAFSVVGITALVDAATGFETIRDRLALERIVNRYLAKEWRPWTTTFPPEFYQELFRLRGWQYKGMSLKRPSVVGHLTNDLIYSRLAPGVLQRLKERVPRNADGKPTRRLHSGLSEDFGVPELKQHLFGITVLMRGFTVWPPFYRAVNLAYPKYTETLTLPLDMGDEDNY